MSDTTKQAALQVFDHGFGDGAYLGERVGVHLAEVYSVDNARRLAACWNACAGISTEALERMPLTMNQSLGYLELQQQVNSLREERDAAWKELRNIREVIGARVDESTFDEVEALRATRDRYCALRDLFLSPLPGDPRFYRFAVLTHERLIADPTPVKFDGIVDEVCGLKGAGA